MSMQTAAAQLTQQPESNAEKMVDAHGLFEVTA